MVTIRALERIEALSDHAPLLLSFGSPPRKSTNEFKFELGWMIRDGFYEMVKAIWEKPVGGQTPILRWNNKMRTLRKFLRGWARHTAGILKKEKLRLTSIIDVLEASEEVGPLTAQQIELKSQSNAEIARLLREEELKWYQRSKAKFIL